MLDGLRLPIYGADDCAALRDNPVHVVGAEISRRRRERSAGDRGSEGVRRRRARIKTMACAKNSALDESGRSRRFERPLST